MMGKTPESHALIRDDKTSVPALKQGATGPEVKKLQKKLKALGFNPGRIDGAYGPVTKAAVRAFQRSRGLPADGIAGLLTRAALRFKTGLGTSALLLPKTVTVVGKMFPFTSPVNIETNLPFILTALKNENLTDAKMVLVALATIRAEAESFEPASELISRYNTSPGGRPFDLYDFRRDLGNLGPPDGERFRGRGFVQLTGRSNYLLYGEEVGLGTRLIENPELANDAHIAAAVLACFIKRREERLRDALARDDLAAARKQVNGGIHGLERFTEAFRIGEKLII
jgi:peptidoglycan L-alanyl-D-glutamate endopeptidase CwlK